MVSKCFCPLRFDQAPPHVTFPCCVPIVPCLGNRSKICKWRQINTGMCRRPVTCHFTLQFLFKNKYWWKTFVTIFGATFARISNMATCFETFLRTQAQQMLKDKWKFMILTKITMMTMITIMMRMITEMAMMMALTRFPPPSHMSSYVGTCSTARASLTPTTAPAPYTYPYPYPKSSIWLQSKKSQPIEIFPPKYVLLC